MIQKKKEIRVRIVTQWVAKYFHSLGVVVKKKCANDCRVRAINREMRGKRGISGYKIGKGKDLCGDQMAENRDEEIVFGTDGTEERKNVNLMLWERGKERLASVQGMFFEKKKCARQKGENGIARQF